MRPGAIKFQEAVRNAGFIADEQTLKGEHGRQTKKADAAQSVKEQAQRTAESLEERLRNARGAHLRHSVNTALNILNS